MSPISWPRSWYRGLFLPVQGDTTRYTRFRAANQADSASFGPNLRVFAILQEGGFFKTAQLSAVQAFQRHFT